MQIGVQTGCLSGLQIQEQQQRQPFPGFTRHQPLQPLQLHGQSGFDTGTMYEVQSNGICTSMPDAGPHRQMAGP